MLREDINKYYKGYHALPDLLEQIPDYDSLIEVTKDPFTKKDYLYKKLSTTSYQLCATFQSESKAKPKSDIDMISNMPHKKGYDCIAYDVPSYLQNTTSFTSSESPQSLQKDQQILEDIEVARKEIHTYFSTYNIIPGILSEVTEPPYNLRKENNLSYDYLPTDLTNHKGDYKLCGMFYTNGVLYVITDDGKTVPVFSNYHCFDFDAAE